ncbi:hypothetical protein JGS6364_17941 [[Clostridium] sordellii]|uniref:Uncharacterized protein n=1 Tax=Paraclostridium sordellii TaxID=1505 RepID=A0ABM9RKP4_PARSO|nr:hypothetical protein [Paeniclostridium sordellii]EPZ58444.1 hypothetical protein H476_1933 [[Clostridium] sordellii VPI 9048] [Paeniclostridium sordellii VPI 9048]MBX9180798.1 hypothetical protein [Paeniclostridium sordellii]MCH1965057.1 hypothetical protein [Paeniclostridium sordellii]MDU1454355.1 hypothetical protein [Paeniclostridium sordellii]MDU2147201.1 hypothetical protein [Paeniclostridium sordellii]
MKKIDKEAMEKFAQEKNIDKGKIEDIANGYKDKSEDELMDELIKIGKTLKGKEEVVEKFKTFLDENQRKKVDSIMNKIANAESKEKVNSKKSKKSKADQSKKESSNKKSNKPENNKSSKSHKAEQVDDSKPGKKVKKVIKKVKKSEA